MTINALNCGAKVWLADLEDATSPTWTNVIGGQHSLFDAIRGQIDFTSPRGQGVPVGATTPTIVFRPRGWHLTEKHLEFTDRAGQICAASASLVDAGLYLFHNAQALIDSGRGPYLYLPKLEGHLEARLWDEIFRFTETYLGLRYGTIRATVLIETITAAFEMEEILYELRDHCAGLNAGRWDYIFSVIKNFRARGPAVRPAGPRQRHDDRPVHEGVHRAARRHLPQAGRAGHRRHERVHPRPSRPGGHRQGARAGQGRQAARGRAGVRRHLGGAPRPRARRARGVRRGARRPRSTSGTACARTSTSPRRSCSTSRRPAAASPGPSPTAGCAATCRWASGTSRRGCGASARSPSTTSWRTPRRPRSRGRRCGSGCTRGSSPPRAPASTPRGSSRCSRRCWPTCPRTADDRYDDAADLFRQVALAEDFPTFLTVPAYTQFLVAH